MLRSATAACLLFAGLASRVWAQDVDPIVIKGSKFFYKTNGTQFYIKGIAYQQNFVNTSSTSANGYTDPLADPSGCSRDIPYLKQLHTNVVRVYAVDPTQDHSQCMSMLADAGIYVLADLGAPESSINSVDPSWTTTLYARYTSVVDALANYTNTLGFFAGNEVVFNTSSADAAPFVKAAVRDTKAYIKSQNYRQIGVGYAADDNQYIRSQMADYMNCGSDQADAVDFWGYNVYSWCGADANFETSGYQTRTEFFQNFSIPVFFAEYGCIVPPPRTFDDTSVIYGPLMDDVWSGAIVYLYFQEENGYGLVEVNGDSVTPLSGFSTLSSKIATVSPTLVNSATYTPTNSPQSCPPENANFSAVTALPPTPNSGLCSCMYDSLSCVVNPDASPDSYAAIFNYICELPSGLCDGISANGSIGGYGPYGMCSPQQKLGYVLNQYYSSRSADATACSFAGSAVVTNAATPTGSCVSQLAVASSSVSAAGSAAAAASSSKSAATGYSTLAGYDLGLVTVGFLVNLALISGVGMVIL